MPQFQSDGYTLSYLDEGSGEPILLIHGFASNKETNWVYPGWVQTLTRAGYRCIAIDNRGHGESEKLYDPALYSSPIMAEDARLLGSSGNRERLRDGLFDGRAHLCLSLAQPS